MTFGVRSSFITGPQTLEKNMTSNQGCVQSFATSRTAPAVNAANLASPLGKGIKDTRTDETRRKEWTEGVLPSPDKVSFNGQEASEVATCHKGRH